MKKVTRCVRGTCIKGFTITEIILILIIAVSLFYVNRSSKKEDILNCFTINDKEIITYIRNDFEGCILPFQKSNFRKLMGRDMTDKETADYRKVKSYFRSTVIFEKE